MKAGAYIAINEAGAEVARGATPRAIARKILDLRGTAGNVEVRRLPDRRALTSRELNAVSDAIERASLDAWEADRRGSKRKGRE
jgi:hypothetical protein